MIDFFLITKGIPGLRGEPGDSGEKGKEVSKNEVEECRSSPAVSGGMYSLSLL